MANDIEGLGSISNIFLSKMNWASLPETQITLGQSVLNYSGTISKLIVDHVFTPNALSCLFTFVNQQDIYNFIEFFVSRKGRVEKFWVLGANSIFYLSRTMPISSSTLYVKKNEFDKIYKGHERIFIELYNGDIITRHITNLVEGPQDDELTLWLDTSTDRELKPEEINVFGRLYLVRFDLDEIKPAFKTPNICNINLRFVELVREYPS